MQYLVIFTPKLKFQTEGVPEDFPRREQEEEKQAQDLYMDGGLRQVWALATKTRGAACLFEAESPDELQKMIDTFPLIKIDYADYQVYPLAPYPSFSKKS